MVPVLTVSFYTVETGELLGYLEWREEVVQETGADFLLMHVSHSFL
jgi:salicylate hydroxylase